DRYRGREEPHLAVFTTVVAGAEGLHVGSCFIRPDVHFPVGGEQQPSHASSSAAIPGRGFPSRNSSEAPPPVETWASLSASPATAPAESAPPPSLAAPRAPPSLKLHPVTRAPPPPATLPRPHVRGAPQPAPAHAHGLPRWHGRRARATPPRPAGWDAPASPSRAAAPATTAAGGPGRARTGPPPSRVAPTRPRPWRGWRTS